MNGASDEERLARIALGRRVEPAHEPVVRAVRTFGAVAVLDAARGLGDVRLPPEAMRALRGGALRPPEQDLEAADAVGARFICPGDEEWPDWLAALRDEEPLGLWVRGPHTVSQLLDRSVAVVGSRAATAYGGRTSSNLAFGLAERRWTVVSGGAYGVDVLAHRGALAAGGTTVVVLACGVDQSYPPAHERVFARIAREGLVISEWAPGSTPRPHRFIVRNRVIAAATRGTVVVEAALRSGALNTGRTARRLGRPLMVVPGPIDSVMSAGCHLLLREDPTTRLVTDPAEVVEEVGRIGDDLAPRPAGEVRPRDGLPPVLRGVLEAVPSVRAVGEAVLAQRAGVTTAQARRHLGELAVDGFVERTPDGWRLSAAERAAIRARRNGAEAAVGVDGREAEQLTLDPASAPLSDDGLPDDASVA